jgi:hypothetical protein
LEFLAVPLGRIDYVRVRSRASLVTPSIAFLAALLATRALAGAPDSQQLSIENDALEVQIDSRSAAIVRARRERNGSVRDHPLVGAEPLELTVPVDTWDGHAVTAAQSDGFKVTRRTENSLTLATGLFVTAAGSFPIAVEIDYRVDGDDLVTRLRIRNASRSAVTAIKFPAVGVEPDSGDAESLSMTSGPRKLRDMFSDNRIRTHHDPFERLDPEDPRGWIRDDPAFPIKAFEYPSGFLLHSAWMHYGADGFGVGIESRDRSFQSQFALIERTLRRDRLSAALNRRSYELAWRWVPTVAPGQVWESPEVHLKFDDGDWHAIARQHRDWLESWLARPVVAQKFRETLGWVSRGISDFDQIPAMARDAVDAGIPYVLLYGWYGGGMSGLSYDFFPQASLGGAESLRRNLREARRIGAYPLAWYNGTTTSEITREHREHGRDWVAVNRHGGIVVDGRWTLFDPDRPPTSDDASTLMNYDMGTPAAAFNVDNVRRMVLDYGFAGFEMDQGAKNYPSYSREGAPRRPELRYSEGVRELYVAAREIVKRQDPDNVIIAEGYSDLMNQYVDSTWTFEGGQVQIPQSTYARYSLPWVTMPAGVFEPDAALVNRAFLFNAPLDVFVDLRRYPEFTSRLRRLQRLKQAVQHHLYDWNFSDEEGFTLQALDESAVLAKSYVARDGSIAVVVVNTSDATQDCSLDIEAAKHSAVATYGLERTAAALPADSRVTLSLAPFDVRVFVVERGRL